MKSPFLQASRVSKIKTIFELLGISVRIKKKKKRILKNWKLDQGHNLACISHKEYVIIDCVLVSENFFFFEGGGGKVRYIEAQVLSIPFIS